MTRHSDLKIKPLRKMMDVPRAPDDAFRMFTSGINGWWPLDRFSVTKERARVCVLDGEVGGQIYEEDADAKRHVWGTVTVWDPDSRLVLRWHAGQDPGCAQEVEVSFNATDDGTRVVLEHRGWEALNDRAEEVRTRYDSGWDAVFIEAYGRACAR